MGAILIPIACLFVIGIFIFIRDCPVPAAKPLRYKVRSGDSWSIWELTESGTWTVRRLSDCPLSVRVELDEMEEPTVDELCWINAARSQQGEPYWEFSEKFIDECILRNPVRHRGPGGHCLICGVYHHATYDDKACSRALCTSCNDTLKTATQKYESLSDADLGTMRNKELLERMVALDLEDGVISLEHAREDYSRIETMTQNALKANARNRERLAKQKLEERQILMKKDQMITSARNRIMS